MQLQSVSLYPSPPFLELDSSDIKWYISQLLAQLCCLTNYPEAQLFILIVLDLQVGLTELGWPLALDSKLQVGFNCVLCVSQLLGPVATWGMGSVPCISFWGPRCKV